MFFINFFYELIWNVERQLTENIYNSLYQKRIKKHPNNSSKYLIIKQLIKI